LSKKQAQMVPKLAVQKKEKKEKEKEKMKASIYLRTSTTEQHPEKQEKDCIEFAKQRGYDIDYIHYEQLSGYKKNIHRPEYEKVKEKARKGEIKAVIVWALDRWVRDRDTLLDDVTTLKNYGCKLHSVKESYLEALNIEGPIGRTLQDFLLGLIGSLAEIESIRRSDRVKMAFKSHKGKKWGRPLIHTNKKKIVWDLRNQNLSLRKIALATGLSLGKISEICSEKQTRNDAEKTPSN
jgi:DNA invertase Pin-like site-specific DNA recombinase